MKPLLRATCHLVASLVLTAVPPLAAQAADENPAMTFDRARADFRAAAGGDASATPRAATAFKALSEAHPDRPLYLAWWGAAETLKARDGWSPIAKMKAVDTGGALMDKALAALGPAHDRPPEGGGVPESVAVRLVVAGSLIELPDLLGRYPSAKRTIDAAVGSPALAAAPADAQAAVLRLAARAARHDRQPAQEADFLRRALAAEPDGEGATAARARLAELGG